MRVANTSLKALIKILVEGHAKGSGDRSGQISALRKMPPGARVAGGSSITNSVTTTIMDADNASRLSQERRPYKDHPPP